MVLEGTILGIVYLLFGIIGIVVLYGIIYFLIHFCNEEELLLDD